MSNYSLFPLNLCILVHSALCSLLDISGWANSNWYACQCCSSNRCQSPAGLTAGDPWQSGIPVHWPHRPDL